MGVGVGCLFFARREVEQPEPSLWREGNLMSPLSSFFLSELRWRPGPERERAASFLAYATLQFVHSN